ncbi:MAG: cobalamin-dependent protein [Chloroflexota bacterium]
MERKIRVLIAKPGLDGHELGARLISRVLMDAGMEVIYTGPRQTAKMVANSAMQEDVDVVGLSFLGGSQKEHTAEISRLLKANGMSDVVLVVGGVIPPMDVSPLKKSGADGVFPSGADIVEITKSIRDLVKKKRKKAVTA